MRGREDGRKRVVIEGVAPEVDCGRFPIKRVAGDRVAVEADIFADGHDLLACALKYRREQDQGWREAPMEPLVNDRWRGEFPVAEIGRYRYTLEAWIDPFRSWRHDLQKRVEASQATDLDLLVGAGLLEKTSRRAAGEDRARLKRWASELKQAGNLAEKIALGLDEEVAAAVQRYPDRRFATTYSKELAVVVDREKARFSSWYELFPRSAAPEPEKHGTFKDVEAFLPYVAGMGFDVLYFPPIHPIGRAHRKGKNNRESTGSGDPGSPWAIGAEEGGHKAIHPRLGTIEDFRRLVARAADHGIEIALDIAFQCSPDHPYVKEHPEWFLWRPDRTIQYAENPPKKYQDIYPLHFEAETWKSLWQEAREIVLYWIAQGVRIFRVDNPHTKPFDFWEWLIAEVKQDHPDAIFLAEAFTRPKVMYRLAKLGFTQSYTYFAWRNTKWELLEYFTELTQTRAREFFHPSVWTNTPDILTEYLQSGGRPAFMARLVLAATLAASYGIYGPAFELCEARAREAGSEEYLNSEKYEIKHWDIRRCDSLSDFISRVNRIRRENPALQQDARLSFHRVDNDQIICYAKNSEDLRNLILIVVNLDPHHTQSGWVELPLQAMGLDPHQPFQAHDLLTDARYRWQGPRNYVELNPGRAPAHILRLEQPGA